MALYLFLVTVADADGLSWYSDATLCRQLSYGEGQLQNARAELQRAELIAYRKPLYQVLDLSPATAISPTSARCRVEAASVGEILNSIIKGGVR